MANWVWPRLRNLAIQSIIAQSPPHILPVPEPEDSVVWLAHPSGLYVHCKFNLECYQTEVYSSGLV